MPRKPRIRQCMRCGHINPGSETSCGDCGTSLVKKRFVMDARRIQKVHAIAHGRKGLNKEQYQDVLAGIGVQSCKEFKARHYKEFLNRMNKLPDVRRAA